MCGLKGGRKGILHAKEEHPFCVRDRERLRPEERLRLLPRVLHEVLEGRPGHLEGPECAGVALGEDTALAFGKLVVALLLKELACLHLRV